MLPLKRLSVVCMAAALLAVGADSAWSAPPRQANWDPALAPYLSKLQAQSDPDFIEIMKALAAPDMIAKLVQQYEAGGDLTKVDYAIHGLAVCAGRPGGDADRRMFATALVAELPKVKPATRGFLIRQLQAAGAMEATSAIGAYLLEPENSEYAAQALVAFGGDAAAEAVRTALPKAEGKIRATLAQAAGSLRDAKAIPLLKPLATDENRDVRLCALLALANIGDAGSADLLLKGVTSESSYEGAECLDAVVKLAARCEEAKDAATADRIYTTLWGLPEEQRAARCAGLQGLARVEGDKAMPVVTSAMGSSDLEIRTVAIQAAGVMPGAKATEYWLGKLAGANGGAKADILRLLGRRGDASALSAVTEQLKSSDQAVRLAAIAAVAGIGGQTAVPTLLPLMASGDVEKQAVIDALATMQGGASADSLAKALPSAEPALKVVLLAVLTQRGTKDQLPAVTACLADKDAAVRAAALGCLDALGDETTVPQLLDAAMHGATDAERQAAEKSAVAVLTRSEDDAHRAATLVAALSSAKGDDRIALTRILGQIGGKQALDTLVTLTKDANADAQEAAIRSLANSTRAQAEPALADLAKSAPKPALQILSLRGYIRLVGADEALSPAEKVAGYKAAMALATRPEEKRLVLSGLAGVTTPAAFDLAAASLDDEAVRNEAASAVVAIGQRIPGSPAMAAAAQKILTFASDNNLKRDAENLQRKAGRR